MAAKDLRAKDLPARVRASRATHELRAHEWMVAQPLTDDQGEGRPANGRTILSLRHDIMRPDNDRDYRSLCIFSTALL